MVTRARLAGDVDLDQAAAALGRILAAYPPGTPHGALLGQALRPRSPAEKQAGPRPPAEVAVRALLSHGQTPTPKAVAAEAERRHARAVSRSVRRERDMERLRPLAEEAAPVIAELAAEHERRYGHLPACQWLAPRVAGRLGIRCGDAWSLIHLFHQEPPA
jgi:hypothetical protein